MKSWRILLALYLGFVLSSLLLAGFGPSGLRRYRALTAYREVLTSNIEELQEIQRRLAFELEELRTDPEQIALLARELGYFRAEERVIRMDGSAASGDFYRVGKLVHRSGQERRGGLLLRVICPLLPVAFYVLLRARRRGGWRENRGR